MRRPRTRLSVFGPGDCLSHSESHRLHGDSAPRCSPEETADLAVRKAGGTAEETRESRRLRRTEPRSGEVVITRPPPRNGIAKPPELIVGRTRFCRHCSTNLQGDDRSRMPVSLQSHIPIRRELAAAVRGPHPPNTSPREGDRELKSSLDLNTRRNHPARRIRETRPPKPRPFRMFTPRPPRFRFPPPGRRSRPEGAAKRVRRRLSRPARPHKRAGSDGGE